jgi:PAP2 superfamily
MIETQGAARLQPSSRARTMTRAILFIAASLSPLVDVHLSTASAASIVTEWLDEALPDAQDVAWEPTVGSRFLAILHTAIYDAWTAYDPVAVGVVSGTTLKNKGGANNEANKREAISHAAYTVLRALAPSHRHSLIERMQALGYDPNADTAPAKIGRQAANAVLAACREDGANELGGFADTTGYAPRKSDAPDAWQPLEFFGKHQLPTTPQWGRVLPFALIRADQFRPIAPPAPGTDEWSRQIDAMIKSSGALTDLQKAEAEYWGISGIAPPPQLFELTKFFSDTNDLRLDDDVKLFFVIANAILDASIATWDSKYVYDYIRPITAIHKLGDTKIRSWRPRSLPTALAYSTPSTQKSAAYDSAIIPAGTGEVRAADWAPYLPTPPFPAYVSGHSAFTAAWARVMELASGRSALNFRTTVRHLYVEQRELAQPVTLDYPTFASAAEASGMSRIWAGVHWPADNEQGQELGRRVGENAWQRAQQFVLGTASPATAVFFTLYPPYWFHENKITERPAHFQTAGGLAIDLPAGGAGAWRSIVIDPMPAGIYELRLKITVTGDQAIHLNVSVQASEQTSSTPLGATDAAISAASSASAVTVPWTSDGLRPFRMSIEARSNTGSGRVLISAINATRIWPVVAGSPRYYEPSSAGH